MKVTDYLKNKDVFLIENCKSKTHLYEMLLPSVISTEKEKVSRGKVIKIINQREKGGSFIVKEGCATPHARLENMKDPIVKFCYIKNGINFENGKICNFVIVFVTPLDKTQTHLQIMAKTLNLFKKEEITHRIKNAKTSDEIFNIIVEDENKGHLHYSNIAKEAFFAELSVNENGLSTEEAEERIKKTGKNLLKKQNNLSVFKNSVKGLPLYLTFLSLTAGLICFIPKIDLPYLGAAIIAGTLAKIFLSYKKSFNAGNLTDLLQNLISVKTKVLRDGKKQEIDSWDLAVGDIVFFEKGDIITADARLIETENLKISNKLLTGEPKPINKTAEPVKNDSNFLWTELPNMVFAGTEVNSGKGKAVVVGTGMNTEFGMIASVSQSLKKSPDFIKNKTKKILNSVEVICTDKTGIITSNKLKVSRLFIDGKNYQITGDENESNGDYLDEKGKITEKKSLCNKDIFKLFFRTSVLCNGYSLIEQEIAEDSAEAALLVLAKKSGFDINEINSSNKKINYFPFESLKESVSSINRTEEGDTFVYAKGPLPEILENCGYIFIDDEIRELSVEDRINIKEKNEQLASEGLSVTAFAYKKTDKNDFPTKEEAENDLVFIGMAGIEDPIRTEVPEAVKKMKEAGIKIHMITGDSDIAAMAAAQNAGLVDNINNCISITGFELSHMDDNKLTEILTKDKPLIFSKMEPVQKMRIVTCIKNSGKIVTVTGRGAADIMAFKSAHVGIAMGNNSVSPVKEAADLTVSGESLASILEI